MGHKSGIKLEWKPNVEGINKKTKAGREEINNIYESLSKLANEYLDIIEKNAKDIATHSKDVGKASRESENVEKEAIKEEAKKKYVIATTKNKAEFINPDELEEAILAHNGDKEKAKEFAEKIRRNFPGKRVKLYGRKILHAVAED